MHSEQKKGSPNISASWFFRLSQIICGTISDKINFELERLSMGATEFQGGQMPHLHPTPQRKPWL